MRDGLQGQRRRLPHWAFLILRVRLCSLRKYVWAVKPYAAGPKVEPKGVSGDIGEKIQCPSHHQTSGHMQRFARESFVGGSPLLLCESQRMVAL